MCNRLDLVSEVVSLACVVLDDVDDMIYINATTDLEDRAEVNGSI